jgi:hypothetical protein
MKFNFKKTCLVLCLGSSVAFGVDSQDSLIFSSEKIANSYNMAYKQNKGFDNKSWLQSIDIANQFVSNFVVSKNPNYREAQNFYLSCIKEGLEDSKSALENKKYEYFFSHVDKLSNWEEALKIMTLDEKKATSDLTSEELDEVKRIISRDEKVKPNRAIPPEADRCFEAITVKRTRLGNSDTMVNLETSELDISAIISFNSLPRFKSEEEKRSDFGFAIGTDPSINYNSGKTSKYVTNLDEYKTVYSLTSGSFYRGSDFRIRFNKDNGFLFLQDLTLVGDSTQIRSISKGTKSNIDVNLLKKIEVEDSTKLPKKTDLFFDFDLQKEEALAVQMRFLEKKSSFKFFEGGDVAEWIVNFVRSKNKDMVINLMNDVLLKQSIENSNK